MNDMRFRGFFSVNLIFEILRSYMLLILPSFLYFDKGRRSYPRASCKIISYLVWGHCGTNPKILESLEGPEGYLCPGIHILGIISIYGKPF